MIVGNEKMGNVEWLKDWNWKMFETDNDVEDI